MYSPPPFCEKDIKRDRVSLIGFLGVLTAHLLTQVGKPPDVSQPHRVADDAQKELHFAGPGSTVRVVASRRAQWADRTTLGRWQDDGHTMPVAASSRVERRHFVTVVGSIIAQNTAADYHPGSLRIHLSCIGIACHDWFRPRNVFASGLISPPGN